MFDLYTHTHTHTHTHTLTISLSQTELQSKVKKIYDEYLASSSPHTVNIDDRVVKLIEERLNNPPLDIFSEAQEQVCVCV